MHPDWNRGTGENDISIIFLDEGDEWDFNDRVQAVERTDSAPEEGDPVTAAGWGKDSDAITAGVTDVIYEVTRWVAKLDLPYFLPSTVVCYLQYSYTATL